MRTWAHKKLNENLNIYISKRLLDTITFALKTDILYEVTCFIHGVRNPKKVLKVPKTNVNLINFYIVKFSAAAIIVDILRNM